MMKFNIIDGTQDNTDYDQILQDYQNLDLTVREIQEKHGITVGKWQSITREWRKQGIQLRGRYKQTRKQYPNDYIGSKNYYYNKSMGKYRVSKNIRGKNYCFGSYENEADAIDRVRELRENGWDGLL